MEPTVQKIVHPHSVAERNRIVGFLDGQLRSRAGFSIQEEYPAVFSEYPGGESIIFEQGGRILSHVGMVVRQFHHPDFRLKLGLIGSVATSSEAQNKGLATQLLQSALNELKNRGCALAVLWTDQPEFYNGLGFVRGGRERDFRFNAQSLTEPAVQSVPFDPMSHGHWIWRLYLKHTGRLDRSLEEQKKLFRIPKVKIFVTLNGAEVTSYLAIHKGADFTNYIHEWGGELMAVRDNIASTQRQFFADQPLTLISPAYYDLAPLRSIANEEWPGVLGMVKVLDRGALLSTYQNYLKRHHLPVPAANPMRQDEEIVRQVLGGEESSDKPVLPFFLWGFDSI